MEKKIFVVISVLLFILTSCGNEGSASAGNEGEIGTTGEYDSASNTVKDLRDGQTYKTVKIGDQVWMAENLGHETTSSICGEKEFLTLYGCLYSWNEAKTVCPVGWHLPSQAEWNTLIEFVGDSLTRIHGAIRGITKTAPTITALPCYRAACAFRNGARHIRRSSIREPFSGVLPKSMTTSQSHWFCVTKTMPRPCLKTTRTQASVSAA